jgi:predicted metalloprotease with PDZ domain
MDEKPRAASAARAVLAWLFLLVPARAACAQAARDTLVYSVAVVPIDAHLSVEARITAPAGLVLLVAPPAAGPAGTHVAGLAATDDRGGPLEVRHSGSAWTIALPERGAVRFRYRLDFHHRVAEGSTGSGLDSLHLYAVTRSLFVAPDPTAYRKTGQAYPVVHVHVIPPGGWHTVAGWPGGDDSEDYAPESGDALFGATLAAAPDFRFYDGMAGHTHWRLAVRGHRYFADSALVDAIRAGLGLATEMLGPAPTPAVIYTSDIGRKGRTSGSLQGTASIGLVWEPGEVLELGRAHDLFHETLHLWFGGALETERWWIEGVTDYVAARLYGSWQHSPEEFAHLCWQSLRNYQRIEHRTRMTMTEENRNHVGGDNTELLVYRKGMLVGLLLDAAIRRGSRGHSTLDDLSRSLLALAAPRRAHSVREAELHDAAVVLGGAEVERVWARVVTGTELLTEDDVATALQVVTGRTFTPPPLAKTRKELMR